MLLASPRSLSSAPKLDPGFVLGAARVQPCRGARAAAWRDPQHGGLALHVAVRRRAPLWVVQQLVLAYPPAILARDSDGATPETLALRAARAPPDAEPEGGQGDGRAHAGAIYAQLRRMQHAARTVQRARAPFVRARRLQHRAATVLQTLVRRALIADPARALPLPAFFSVLVGVCPVPRFMMQPAPESGVLKEPLTRAWASPDAPRVHVCLWRALTPPRPVVRRPRLLRAGRGASSMCACRWAMRQPRQQTRELHADSTPTRSSMPRCARRWR